MQTFAERLISLREDKGWKKKELAEKLHVSDSMISQYESGRCMPSYDVIITIARLFHVSVDYLLCGSAEAFPSSDVFVAQISQAEFLEKCRRLSPDYRRIINTIVDSFLANNEKRSKAAIMIDEKSIIPKSADDSTYVQMFYKAYHKLLYREARKYLNSTEDIDDIVQDSVVKLIENLDTIRSLSPNRQVSYAVTVTRNLAINLLIRQKRITLESLDELEPYVKDSNDLEAQVGHHEKLQLFHTVWKQMPTDIRLLLEQKYILGQADAEIAADLGTRPESVRMRLTRAKRIAAKELLKNGFITGIDEF